MSGPVHVIIELGLQTPHYIFRSDHDVVQDLGCCCEHSFLGVTFGICAGIPRLCNNNHHHKQLVVPASRKLVFRGQVCAVKEHAPPSERESAEHVCL